MKNPQQSPSLSLISSNVKKMTPSQFELYKSLHTKSGDGAQPGAAYVLFNEGPRQLPVTMLKELVFHALPAPKGGRQAAHGRKNQQKDGRTEPRHVHAARTGTPTADTATSTTVATVRNIALRRCNIDF